MSEPRFTGRRFHAAALAGAVLLALAAPPSMAADETSLQRVKGTVQYKNEGGTPTAIVGKLNLPDSADAITQSKSAAMLTLADSSIVALGENTDVNVGAFRRGAAGPGSTIVLNNGTLRFDVRRPTGATADYHFTTPTTQIAVRGTVGLLSVLGGNTTVACLACAADSVSVTVSATAQTFTLITGQVLTVTAAGVAAVAATTASVIGGFSAAGVSTSAASGAAAATAGVASGAGVLGGSALGTAAIAAGAAGAVAAGVSAANPAKTDQPSSSQTSPSPSPSGTSAGSINLTGAARPPAGPPVARPLPAPTTGSPGRH